MSRFLYSLAAIAGLGITGLVLFGVAMLIKAYLDWRGR